MNLRRMLLISVSVPIIIVQEYALVSLPNIQFTVLLIILFSTIFTFKESIIMIFVYVLLDSLLMGAFNPLYMIPMFLGWSVIPLVLNTVLKNTRNELTLAFFAFVFGFIYGWMFIPFRMMQYGVTILTPYLIADLPYEIVMAVVGFVTVLLAYKPLYKVLHLTTAKEIYE